MLFNSYVFLFAFLPAVLAGWWGLSRWRRLRLAFLTCASWFSTTVAMAGFASCASSKRMKS